MTDRYVWVVTDTFTEFGGDHMTVVLAVADSLEAGVAIVEEDFAQGQEIFETVEWVDEPQEWSGVGEWYHRYRVENMGTNVTGLYAVERHELKRKAAA
jgi:hypothetical protein